LIMTCNLLQPIKASKSDMSKEQINPNT